MSYNSEEYNVFAEKFISETGCQETTNFKYLMPGDLMGPDQIPFNYNWNKLDTTLKDMQSNIADNTSNLTNLNNLQNSYALKSELPDISKFITIEDVEAKNYLTDSSISTWAKAAEKPSYNSSEIIVDTANNKSLATLITELQSEIGTLKEKISKLEGGAVE